ncbi:hypothetical protein HaLaN_17280 [Haematococcus lacustris]|uniref:Uncharacterized protein n=1 Tax=Haematococcus lacustris TaxID=44745 RepID=A0A699ZNY2_HAELA|nr:hypothetical protein HaLaN_17280 [Haematococcus lacustris]
MGPRPSTVADEAWPAPDFAVMAGPAGACIAVHRVLLCLASSTLASAIEVQPAVVQLKGLLAECLAWCNSFALSPNPEDPHYVVKWMQWLQPAHAAALHDAPASRLNVLQGLLADEEGCSKLSVPTLLALARIPISRPPGPWPAATRCAAAA